MSQTKSRLESRSRPRLRLAAILISPFVIYLLVSIIYFGPEKLSTVNKDLFTPGGDSQLIVWSLNWWPFSLAHHLNPFVSKYIWAPEGFNLTWATSVPTLGIIMAPVTLIFSAVLSFNILALVSPALSAFSCFYLVYYISRNYWGALVSGYIFGFSSYELGQMLGHTSLYSTFLIPLLVLVFLMRLQNRLSRLRFISLTSVMLVLQFGISNEIFASFMLFATMGVGLYYISTKVEDHSVLVAAGRDICWALVLSLVILSPYIYYLIVGYKNVPRVINSPFLFSSEPLNYVIPTPVTQIGGRFFKSITQHFTGNFSEDGAYIGLPLLIIVINFFIKYWRKAYVKVMATLMLISVVLSLGTFLKFSGKSSGVVLPWELFSHIPLIRSALPGRFTMYMFLIVAVTVGVWLSLKTTAAKKRWKNVFVILAITTILPNTAAYSWRQVDVPRVFTKSSANRYIKSDSNIIILPYGYLGSSLYYQYASGMSFRQTGGYIGFIPTTFSTDPAVKSLYSGIPSPNFDKDLYNFCVSHNISEIVYTQDTAPALASRIKKLGWNEQQVDDATVVEVKR